MTSATDNTGDAPVRLIPVGPPRRLRLQLRHLMILVVVCGLGLAESVRLVVRYGPGPLIVIVIVLLFLAIGAVVVAIKGYRAQQDALLWALAVAAERGMPLAPALYAIAEQGGFYFRNRVIALADMLSWGATFPEALDRVPGVLPRDAEIMARVGWEAGTLPGALRDSASARSDIDAALNGFFARLSYLLLLAIAMQGIVAFIMYFILPKFEAIFADFGTPLPQATIVVVQASHFVIKYGYIAAIGFFLEVGLLVALRLASWRWLVGTLPYVDLLFLRRHSGVILRTLARLVEAGKPLNPGFGTLARRYPTPWVRDRLRAVALDIDRGTDWCRALSYNGLISEADAAVLESARKVGNLPWALRETADVGERRLAYRLQALLQLLFPVLVLGMGFLVFTLAVAYFTPLVSLIQRLSG